MHRLRRGASAFGGFSGPLLRKKALNSWAAVQDTFFSTKDIFERHRVVFTVGTSIASVATAWGGYSLRHYHETKVDQRLESIERAVVRFALGARRKRVMDLIEPSEDKHLQLMKNNFNIKHNEIKKIVHRDSSNTAACIASAGSMLIIGYALGWRGGRWYTTRKFRREQVKQLGLTIPSRWQMLFRMKPRGGLKLQFLKGSSVRPPVSSKPCQDPAGEAPGGVAHDA